MTGGMHLRFGDIECWAIFTKTSYWSNQLFHIYIISYFCIINSTCMTIMDHMIARSQTYKQEASLLSRCLIIHCLWYTQWPWLDLSMPPKVKCHGVNWKTIYDLLYLFFMQNLIRCFIEEIHVQTFESHVTLIWPWELSNVKWLEVNW